MQDACQTCEAETCEAKTHEANTTRQKEMMCAPALMIVCATVHAKSNCCCKLHFDLWCILQLAGGHCQEALQLFSHDGCCSVISLSAFKASTAALFMHKDSVMRLCLCAEPGYLRRYDSQAFLNSKDAMSPSPHDCSKMTCARESPGSLSHLRFWEAHVRCQTHSPHADSSPLHPMRSDHNQGQMQDMQQVEACTLLAGKGLPHRINDDHIDASTSSDPANARPQCNDSCGHGIEHQTWAGCTTTDPCVPK